MNRRKLHQRLSSLAQMAGEVLDAAKRTAYRMVYQVAYVLALNFVFGNPTPRRRKLLAERFARKAQENAQKSTPAATSLLLNVIALWALSTWTIRNRSENQPPEITATVDSQGFLLRTQPIKNPTQEAEGGEMPVFNPASIGASGGEETPTSSRSTLHTRATSPLSFKVDIPTGPGIIPQSLRPAGSTGGKSQGTHTQRRRGLSAKIGNLNIQYQKLGVLLDVSGSMENHAKAAQKQAKSYPQTSITEIEGCAIAPKDEETDPGMQNAMPQLIQLAESGIDTLIWICDLQDEQDPTTLKEIEERLLQLGVRLHVSSWEHVPSPKLMEIIRKTGGSAEICGVPYPLPLNDPRPRTTELVFESDGYAEVRGLPPPLPGEPTRTYAEVMELIERKHTKTISLLSYPMGNQLTREQVWDSVKKAKTALLNLPVQADGTVRSEQPIIPKELLGRLNPPKPIKAEIPLPEILEQVKNGISPSFQPNIQESRNEYRFHLRYAEAKNIALKTGIHPEAIFWGRILSTWNGYAVLLPEGELYWGSHSKTRDTIYSPPGSWVYNPQEDTLTLNLPDGETQILWSSDLLPIDE